LEIVMNSRGRKGLIAYAVATALGAGAAYGLDPSQTPDFVLYAAGGSAQANAFSVAANQILSSPDSYSDSTSACGDSGAYRVWFGATKNNITFNGATVTAGTKLLMLYKFNGGSFPNGVVPQIDPGSNLLYPTIAAILSTSTTSQTCTNAGAPKYFYSSSGQITNSQLPDWGVSDVEVSMFTGYNNPGTCATNVTTANCLGANAPTVAGVDGIYDNLFGIAETHNMYTDTTHPKTNFTRAEMGLIMQGSITNWNQIYDDNGAPLAPGPVVFLDRGPGSGSKASGSQYFLGYPGDGGGAALPRSAKSGYTGTALNTATCTGAGTGPALQDVNEGSTTGVVNDLIAAQNAGCRAVAILGLENPPALHQNGGSTNLYDFTAINGVFVDGHNPPGDDINGTGNTTYRNAASGAYDFYYQNSFNTRSGFLAGTSTGALVANQVITQMQAIGFPAAGSGQSFPNSVNGTLQDADKLAAPAAGGTMATRNKNSTAPLIIKFKASNATSGVPVGTDPL
jgi:hypothetical protein